MKRMLLLLSFVSWSIFASPFPVISSLNVTYDKKGADYDIKQRVVEIGSAGDYRPPSGWFAGLGHKHSTGGDFVGALDLDFMTTEGTATISEIMMDAYNAGEKDITRIRHNGDNGYEECVGYFAGPPISGNSTVWNQTITPGGCLIIPPGYDWCKITSPEIVLEHGTITLKDAEGSIAESSMGVQCTTPVAVTFNLISQDKYVYLDEGKSEITVGDKPLNSKIDLPQGDSQVVVKDLLTGINTEGFHTGSSVLVMTPY